MGHYRRNQYPPYISVEQRAKNAERHLQELYDMGMLPSPVQAKGRQLTRHAWGKAWCKHIEFFSECSNRMPRGRSFIRHGGLCHLQIESGVVEARVSGSELYNVRIKIAELSKERWDKLQQHCPIPCDQLLKQYTYGKHSEEFSHAMLYCMRGLFPQMNELTLSCNCPDWASVCKHVAATLYGVGIRLDETPTQLFELRGINTAMLINTKDATSHDTMPIAANSRRRKMDDTTLANLFDITLSDS